MWKMWISLLLILKCHLLLVFANKVHLVHWNSTNPLFFNRHTIDIQNSGQLNYEQADIVCPYYDPSVPRTLTEQWVIYNVSKFDYDQCRVSNFAEHSAKIVAICNTPYEPKFFTLTFRAFSPTPGAFEFHPGQEYYFISAPYFSHKSQRPRPIECSHPPMRLAFRIRDTDVTKNDFENHHDTKEEDVENVASDKEEDYDYDPLPIISSLSSSLRMSIFWNPWMTMMMTLCASMLLT